jgi:uncharacterized membrane protein
MRARDFKARAREGLSGNWFVAAIAGIIATLFGASGVGSITFRYEQQQTEVVPVDPTNIDLLIQTFMPIITGALLVALVYCVVALIIGSGISVGYSKFNVDMIEGEKPRLRTLFSHFGQWKTAFGASFLIALRILFGFILFVVPGIIAAMKYSMTFHVIADNPGIRARDAMRESKRIMRGYKWNFFCLLLSFIGWDLLTAITMGLVAVFAVPYKAAAKAAFYNEIK